MRNYKNNTFSKKDIEKSKKILFTIFTRYGDTIIDLIIIKEFIEKYNNKKYLLLCPKQMVPYAKIFLPNVKSIGFNKRNIFDFIRINLLLKKAQFDIGFNPWSNGLDSCYLISFCKKFLCYRSFVKSKPVNHYEIVRMYFHLPLKRWYKNNFKLKDYYKNILICPNSTDKERSLSKEETNELVKILKELYKNTHFTIASPNEQYMIENINYIKLEKTNKSSVEFLKCIKSIDLAICVDSGPLHIITNLKKDVIGIFNTTQEEYVINTNTKINTIYKNNLIEYFKRNY